LPWVLALQVAAVLGYTATAAFNMPELTIDHCGPLVKNLPVLALIMLLWSAAPAQKAHRRAVRAASSNPVSAGAATARPASPSSALTRLG
jgi:hypothetical protein